MRRKEREVICEEEKLQIIKECQVCRVAFAGEFPYIVPVNYGMKVERGELVLYFHGAMAGRKYEIVKKAQEEGKVIGCGFTMDQKSGLTDGNTACDYSYRYESIVGTGVVELVEEREEKKQGLNDIMKHMTGRGFSFTDDMVEKVAVFRIRVKEYRGKRNT